MSFQLPSAVTTATAATLATAGTAAHAVLNPRSQLFGPVLVAPPLPNQLALTFDDGPNPSATPRLLEVLARHRVRATFFLIGNFVLRCPALTREIASAGHLIGNHTFSHPRLPRHSARRIYDELSRCNQILEDTLGQPVTLFRPPHGSRSPAVARAAAALHLTTVQWNLIAGDWKPLPAATLLQRLERGIARNQRGFPLFRRPRGTTVVLHDGGQHTPSAPRLPTVEAVNQLLTRLPAETRFVTPPLWT